MFIATIVVGSLLAVMYIAAGAPKVLKAQSALTQAEELKIAPTFYQCMGVLELLGAAGVLVGLRLSWLGVAAGSGLALLMVGAVATHLRAGQSAKQAAPAIVCAALAIGYIVVRILSA
jgi:uncharacterized membrane protein YphA (DoxX/SURF4 family)